MEPIGPTGLRPMKSFHGNDEVRTFGMSAGKRDQIVKKTIFWSNKDSGLDDRMMIEFTSIAVLSQNYFFTTFCFSSPLRHTYSSLSSSFLSQNYFLTTFYFSSPLRHTSSYIHLRKNFWWNCQYGKITILFKLYKRVH